MFITLEGGEGSGKSTLISKLKSHFESQGRDVIVTREPGGSQFAEELRQLIFKHDIDALTEMLLFAAARRDHLNRVIKPALNDHKIVICDRFIDSSLVYQGMQSSEKDIYHKVEDINQLVSESHNLIDVTLLLDIDPKIGLERISTNNRDTNSYDERSIDFHQSVREGYLKLAKQYPDRIKIINANQSKDCILEESLNHLVDL